MKKQQLKTINIDIPEWMVLMLDHEAQQLGINRKAAINVLLGEILKSRKKDNPLLGDFGYLKAVEDSLKEEWGSKEDDKAFKDL